MKTNTKTSHKKILIVGAGVTGLGLVGFLEDKGIDITIVDKLAQIKPKGSGLSMMPPGMKVIERLGLGDDLRAIGSSARSMKISSIGGKLLSEIKLKDLGIEPVTLARADLHKVLMTKLKTTKIKLGLSVKSLKQTKSRVTVTFTDDTQDSFDLVIGADGINSVVRTMLFPRNIPKKAGVAMWTFLLPTSYRLKDADSVQQIWGDNRFMGVFPIDNGGTVTFVKPLDPSINPWEVNLQKSFSDMSPEAKKMLKVIDPATIATSHLREIKLSHWQRGRVLLAGDAAHAMMPITGLGASMGLQDAEAIADLILATPRKNLARVARQYEKARMPVANKKQREAYMFGRIIFTNKFLENIRNAVSTVLLSSWGTRILLRMM